MQGYICSRKLESGWNFGIAFWNIGISLYPETLNKRLPPHAREDKELASGGLGEKKPSPISRTGLGGYLFRVSIKACIAILVFSSSAVASLLATAFLHRVLMLSIVFSMKVAKLSDCVLVLVSGFKSRTAFFKSFILLEQYLLNLSRSSLMMPCLTGSSFFN